MNHYYFYKHEEYCHSILLFLPEISRLQATVEMQTKKRKFLQKEGKMRRFLEHFWKDNEDGRQMSAKGSWYVASPESSM